MGLYYEAHVTIEPVFDERLDMFSSYCSLFGFHPAKLLMQKRKQDTPERSNKDTFCTGRGQDYEELHKQTLGLVKALQDNGFQVWRYKIEDTLLDVRLTVSVTK